VGFGPMKMFSRVKPYVDVLSLPTCNYLLSPMYMFNIISIRRWAVCFVGIQNFLLLKLKISRFPDRLRTRTYRCPSPSRLKPQDQQGLLVECTAFSRCSALHRQMLPVGPCTSPRGWHRTSVREAPKLVHNTL
jgi:hypothetical protein